MIVHTLLLAALLGMMAARPAAAQTPSGHRVLVIPFENTQHDARVYWLSEAAAILLADELNARGLPAIGREERVRAFEELHLPPSASLSRATIIKVGNLVDASEVIVGTFAAEGETLKVDAHRIQMDVGRLQPDVSERGPLKDLFGIYGRLAERLAPDTATPARAAHPPLDAFENYVKGLIAESPATQATFLETAATQHRGYDRAELALWSVRTDQGDYAAALGAARRVSPLSPLSRRAQFLAGVSLLDLKRYDEAFDVFKAWLDAAPAGSAARASSAAAWNNLGVVQIRRGGSPPTGSATYFLTKAADADPGDADNLFNLGYAYVLERNNQTAIYWLREALRRKPVDADAHYVLAAALLASGSSVEAEREKTIARQLSSRYEELERSAAADKLPVPKGLERVHSDIDGPRGLQPEQAIVDTAQREQRELATFHLERGRRLYEREQDTEAMTELRRVVYLSPYEAQAHLLIGRIHLRAGRPQEAVNALKISIWSEDTAAARIALAEAYVKLQNGGAAREQLERALALDPDSADAKRMLAEMK
jgi:tetratricopeptide (TPR) repeat protein